MAEMSIESLYKKMFISVTGASDMTELWGFRFAAVSSFPFLPLEFVNGVYMLAHLHTNTVSFVVNS